MTVHVNVKYTVSEEACSSIVGSSQKVMGLSPDEIFEFFSIYLIMSAALRPWD
jgi:hypothetical protein